MAKKIALYIDPLKSIHSKFYARVLLKQKLAKLGFIMEIHIPRLKDHSDMNSEELSRIPYVHDTKELERVYHINVHNDMPSPKKYEALLLIENFNSGGSGDNRIKLAEEFQKAKKRVLCVKDDTIFEYSPVNTLTKHGYCGPKLLGASPKWFLNPKFPHFQMPLVSNPKFTKPDALSLGQFCQKYGLDPSLKIVAFLPGRCGKWNNLSGKFDGTANANVSYALKVMEWFNRHFDEIQRELLDRGYQIVSKLHIRDPEKFLQNKNNNVFLHMDRMHYIDQYHSYELLKYADAAITVATTMVYHLYLCDLPTMELGSGVYYPEWSSKKMTKIKFPIPGCNAKELIYGQVIKLDTLSKHGFGKAFDSFMKVDHRKNFKFWKNNPLYGDSYNSSPMDVARTIVKNLK